MNWLLGGHAESRSDPEALISRGQSSHQLLDMSLKLFKQASSIASSVSWRIAFGFYFLPSLQASFSRSPEVSP